MKFNEYIQTKGVYENLYNYGFGIIKKFTQNSIFQQDGEDILGDVFEKLAKRNPDVIQPTFKRGFFAKYATYTTLEHICSSYKKRTTFGNVEGARNSADKEYEEYTPNFINLIPHPRIFNLYTDRYILCIDKKTVLKTHKLTQDQYRNLMEQGKKLLQGQPVNIRQEKTTKIKMKIEEKYKGVCRIDATGNINKVYPKMVDVEKDGLDRTMVSKIVNGKYKHRNYEGFDWWFIRDLKEQNGKEKR